MLKPFTAEGRFECGFNEIIAGKRCALFAVGQEHGLGLGLAVATEPGYHTIPLHWCNGDDLAELAAHAEALNRELFGLDPKTSGLIVASTMRPPAPGNKRPSPSNREGSEGPAWIRTVYFGAYATNDNEGPLYARLEVNPDFIATLLRLRAVCSEHALSQVHVADAPDEMGAGHDRRRHAADCAGASGDATDVLVLGCAKAHAVPHRDRLRGHRSLHRGGVQTR
jgi:hypothetical protein